jgi:MFS transporter, NNP family, nitrate/nitrite transporter
MDTLEAVGRSDRNRALWFSIIAFTTCFSVWTIFSNVGIGIHAELGLSEAEFGLLIATPILSGAISHLILGAWTEQYGGRAAFTAQMQLTALAVWMLTFATTYPIYLFAALGVGLAGGSFIIGAADVSRWNPQERQAAALDIFGTGNVGAAVTKFGAPFDMAAYGRHGVAQLWAEGLVVMAAVSWLRAEDDPEFERRRSGAKPSSGRRSRPMRLSPNSPAIPGRGVDLPMAAYGKSDAERYLRPKPRLV